MTLFNKFIKLLNFQPEKPSMKGLEKIVEAFMLKIPFENLSKLYYLKTIGLMDIPPFEQYLEGIEKYNFGGTCYSNNYYLNLLLNELGYMADLCGTDMNDPDVHLVNNIKIDDREFIVDVGYAAPFIKPLPRDLKKEYTVSLGRDTYILSPRNKLNYSQLNLYRNGELYHGYLMKPKPKQISDFKSVILNSFRSEAAFMNSLLMVKNGIDKSFTIHNFICLESIGKKVNKTELTTIEQVVKTIETIFGIPSSIGLETLNNFHFSKDAWD